MKSFKIKIPKHSYGRSFRFDFPISCKREEGAVGVCAIMKVNYDESSYMTFEKSEDRTLANVSITTDGEVLYPSVPVLSLPDWIVPLRVIMQPTDYVKLGNKLSVVLEECNEFDGEMISYELQIFIKSKRL